MYQIMIRIFNNLLFNNYYRVNLPKKNACESYQCRSDKIENVPSLVQFLSTKE